MSRSAGFLIASLILIFIMACGQGAAAQNNQCVVNIPVNSSCSPDCLYGAPPTTVCPDPCTGMTGCNCTYQTAACTPPNTGPETCPFCNRNKPVAEAAHPINLATGNTYITETDIGLPGLGGGLNLTRTWNSIWPSTQPAGPFMFGRNWRSTYEERVYLGGDGYLKYARSEGSFWSYGVSSNGGGTSVYRAVAPNNLNTTLTTGASSWTLVLDNGEKKTFDNTTGVLLSIIDRNGNTTQLTYDSSNRLVS